MTSIELVKQVYPDAVCSKGHHQWIVKSGMIVGIGNTKNKAWQNAADRLKEKKN